MIKHAYWLPLIALAFNSVLTAQCPTRSTVSSTSPINVVDCGVVPNRTADQTTVLQAAIDASCSQATSSSAAPPVHIPAGQYLFASLSIKCSGLLLYGDGMGGNGGGRGGTQLCSANSTTPMLIVGTPAAPLGRVTLQDFQLSGHCGRAFPPGGLTMACLYCHVSRIALTGFNAFGIEFTGAASLCCGFDDVSQVEIQVSPSTSVPTFAFQVTGLAGLAGGPDGVSVVSSNVNAGCSAPGNGFINFVNPGSTLTASSGWIGNRFEAHCDRTFHAINGVMQLVRFTSNRWENTGSGGLAVTVDNQVNTDPPAVFESNVWACGTGNCTYHDRTGRSVRSQEYYGPSTTGPYLFTTQTSGGGASAVTLADRLSPLGKTALISTGAVPGAGIYRLTVSLILTKSGSAGTISAEIGWNNGVLNQTAITNALSATATPGTEVDGSFLFFVAGNQEITYMTNFVGVAGAPKYSMRVRLEYVSP